MVLERQEAQDGVMSSPVDPSRTPSQTEDAWSAFRGFVRRGGTVFGVALLTLLSWLLIRAMTEPSGLLSIDPGFLFAIVLVAAGVLLLRGQEPDVGDAATARRPRRRSPLGILTLSAAFCVCGLMILLGNLGIADVGISDIVATALLVVGVGLFVGAWWGRSRLLIAIGILLLPVVVLTAFIQFPLRGSVGDRHLTFVEIEEVEESYELLYGNLRLDLLRVEDFPERSQIDLDVAAGRVTIFVPERVGLTVNGHIEWGNATIGRGREEGEDLRVENEIAGTPGEGHLEVNLRGGIASLYIERISHRELYGRTRAEERAEERRRERDAERERAQAREERRRREQQRQRERMERRSDDGEA